MNIDPSGREYLDSLVSHPEEGPWSQYFDYQDEIAKLQGVGVTEFEGSGEATYQSELMIRIIGDLSFPGDRNAI